MQLAHVGNGTLEPLQLIVPLVALAGYFRRARTLGRRGRPVPVARQLSFAAGIAAVLVALVSPVAHLGEELFVAHVAQHLVLADIGALLTVLGLTGPVLAPALRVPVIARLRTLAHPAVSLPLFALNLYLWHLPPLQEGVLESAALHTLMHGLFVTTGILVWMPLFGPLPKPEWFGDLGKLLYIVGMRFAGAVLANVLLWSEVVFYAAYGPGEASWRIEPLRDQGAGGAALMLEESILSICLFGWIFLEAARHGEEKQRLLELAASRGIPLDEKRVRRAVGAGRGPELEQRILAGAPPSDVAAGSRRPPPEGADGGTAPRAPSASAQS